MRVLSGLVCLLLWGCNGQTGGPAAPSAAGEAYLALCSAAAEARAGDVVSARAHFLDGAHQPLHELAAAIDDQRGVAARLLEAKSQVETDFATLDSAVGDHLLALARRTADAIAATGVAPPDACAEELSS